MICKAYITNVNPYTIFIPAFSSGGVDYEVKAAISAQPGINSGYKIGDCVFIDFENDQKSNPIIIGRLGNYESEADNLIVKGDINLSGNIIINGKYFNDLLNEIESLKIRLDNLGG